MSDSKPQSTEQSVSSRKVNIGDIAGGIHNSQIAGNDIIEVGIQIVQQAGGHLTHTRNLPALLTTLQKILPFLESASRAATRLAIERLNQTIQDLPKHEHSYRTRIRRTFAKQDVNYIEATSTTEIIESTHISSVGDTESKDFSNVDSNAVEYILSIDDMPRADLYEWRIEEQRIVRIKLHSLHEAIEKYPCIILLGDPGSGKTTVLEHLAYKYAVDSSTHIPIPVRLSEFYPGISVEDLVVTTLQGSLKVNHWQATEIAANLEGYLEAGRILLLFDALNEMPIEGYQPRARSLRDFIDSWSTQGNRFLVTCRLLDYDKELDGLQRVEIEPFNDEQIQEYLKKTLGKHCDQMWLALKSDSNGNRSLLDMARNPYFLKIMITEFVRRKGQLSGNRAELMQRFTDHLWQRAQRSFVREEWLPIDIQREALAEVAFKMQLTSGSGAVIPTHHVKKLIPLQVKTHPAYSPDPIPSPEHLLTLAASANIIEVPPDRSTVRFYHQLLQEYFAAHYLIQQNSEALHELWYWPWLESETALWQRPPNNIDPLPPPKTTGWEETTIIAAGLDKRNGYKLLSSLTQVNPVLAARCLHEGRVDVDPAIRNKIVNALLGVLGDSKVALRVRIAAGEQLGYLGDPRLGTFVTIPAGIFRMGSQTGSLYVRPEHDIFLSDFQFGKYLVTNAEYRPFVEVGGYKEKQWWTEAGWWFKEKENWIHPRFWNNRRLNKPNQPVVGVNWYECVAFCRWLSMQKGYLHRLPTEAEWEKASRGSDGRRYPWGNEFDAKRVNSDEGEQQIKSTSPVGIFPLGTSPYGAFDCAGNVWEWCATKAPGHKLPHYPYDPTQDEWSEEYLEGMNARLLRGGSWISTEFDLRCTTRLWNYAERGLDYRGFRLVVPNNLKP